jgi:hypothetical protein
MVGAPRRGARWPAVRPYQPAADVLLCLLAVGATRCIARPSRVLKRGQHFPRPSRNSAKKQQLLRQKSCGVVAWGVMFSGKEKHQKGRISMAQQPTHHHKADTTAGDNSLPVAPRPVPYFCPTASSRGSPQLGKPRRAQIRRLLRQCRLWLIEHSLSFHLAHSASGDLPPQLWVALELRNELTYRRLRHVSARSIKSSGPIVIPEIIELEVLRREVPW